MGRKEETSRSEERTRRIKGRKGWKDEKEGRMKKSKQRKDAKEGRMDEKEGTEG